MYATVVRCGLRGVASAEERGRLGRALARPLGALPGFVAFVALKSGEVAALCIVEDEAGLDAAQQMAHQWYGSEVGAIGGGLVPLSRGTVIAQRGL